MGVALITERVVDYCQRRARSCCISYSFHSNQLYITNKTECFSFKSERDMQVTKLIKEGWLIVFTIRISA